MIMLGMIALMPGICFARDYRDALVLNRIWNYSQYINQDIYGHETTFYMSYTMTENHRNPLLWMIPTMYSIAHGDKDYVGEAYGKLRFRSLYDYDMMRQVKSGTIPHQRMPFPALFDMMIPNIYGEQLYQDRLLSPFHRYNKRLYQYQISHRPDSTVLVSFTPRVNNTLLINGEAVVNPSSGRILSLWFEGEFDMVRFKITTDMDKDSPYALPKNSKTQVSFKFMGNNIVADCTSIFGSPKALPDSINDLDSREKMEKLRPIPITHYQDSIYKAHDTLTEERQQKETTDTLSKGPRRITKVKDFFWDVVGDHMVNSTQVGSGKASVNISPLFNPLYMSFSKSKGLSYKLSADFIYKWNEKRYLTLEPNIGYATKVKQFYYTIPVTMTYNPKRYGAASIVWGNGNRTSNGALADVFNQRVGHDSIAMPEFRDEYVNVFNHIGIFDWIRLTTGINYHIRKAVDKEDLMSQAGLSSIYRSFAPYATIHLMPWNERGPVLTANYERSLNNILGSNLRYARWEFDAVYKMKIRGMRMLSLRGGAGFYTQRNTDYFVDYTNFRDNNLPTGWDDDWTGQFQLVDSRWYNESNYYLRGHISYDSPLLALSWAPWVGRFIESERLYFSTLNIEHTRQYFELGYGFKCRYFSTGIFASFLNVQYNAFEWKFTLELFSRW